MNSTRRDPLLASASNIWSFEEDECCSLLQTEYQGRSIRHADIHVPYCYVTLPQALKEEHFRKFSSAAVSKQLALVTCFSRHGVAAFLMLKAAETISFIEKLLIGKFLK